MRIKLTGFSHLKLHVKVQIDIPSNVDAANAGTNVLSCFGDGQSHEHDRSKPTAS